MYSAAADREQAAIVFDVAKQMVLQSEQLCARTELYRRSMVHLESASSYKVLSADAGNLKPAKDKSTERIDGIVALIMAIGRAGSAQPPANRNIRCLSSGDRLQRTRIADASQHETLIERPLVKESKWRYRPPAAVRVSQQLPFDSLLRSARDCRLPALLFGEIDVQVLPIRREVVGIEARNPRMHESIVDLGHMRDQRHVDLCQLRHLPRECRLLSNIGLAQHLLIELVIFAHAESRRIHPGDLCPL